MTDASAPQPRPPDQATRPYSPGLEGVIAGETSLAYVDGERGRLLYRGYRIGDLVERGTLSRPWPTCCGPATGTRRIACRPPPSRRPS